MLVVSKKSEFKKIKGIIKERNILTNKKIHLIQQTEEDFKHDFKLKNKVIVDIIKKGIVLYGQEEYRRIISGEGR